MYRKKLILSKKLDACENDSNDSVRFDQSGEFDEGEEGEPDEGGSDSGASRAASPVGRSHKSHHKVRKIRPLFVLSLFLNIVLFLKGFVRNGNEQIQVEEFRQSGHGLRRVGLVH